ncbi:hypothetical protein RESH_01717 [Rhodopirellula europaea SH398]|uniref:Uncharacterized protein n=1 Tax=Rhodopirellula europaea SH398 TaxID=1263868 RepID=M5S7W6_9BACT|nr:hypothetical protein RESH_01717 [Rhodopirellula europaea SH398]
MPGVGTLLVGRTLPNRRAAAPLISRRLTVCVTAVPKSSKTSFGYVLRRG